MKRDLSLRLCPFYRNERYHHVHGTFCSPPDASLALAPGNHEYTLHTTHREHLGNSPLDTCGFLALSRQILSLAVKRDVMKYQINWKKNMEHGGTFGLFKPILDCVKLYIIIFMCFVCK